MKIVILNMYIPEADNKVVAYADVLIDNMLRIHGIKLVRNKDRSDFIVGMPCRKKNHS